MYLGHRVDCPYTNQTTLDRADTHTMQPYKCVNDAVRRMGLQQHRGQKSGGRFQGKREHRA
eukprot:4056747-Prymnesium_polylepis.1